MIAEAAAESSDAEYSAALSVSNLHAYYGSSHVVKGVSFEVAPGAGMAILGRNGAGKTTTLRSMMGLVEKTKGKIDVYGADMTYVSTHLRARHGLAMVFEDRRIFPTLTVRQNLMVPSRKSTGAHLPLEELFDMFPLIAAKQSQEGGTLSGGEQQMLAIARAVKSRPSVLLLDEPSEGLAPKIVDELVERINELRERLGVTIVVAEHKQWFSREVTELVGVLTSESGDMVFQGSWSDFDARPEITEQYLSVGKAN